jgi:hypothetical protein
VVSIEERGRIESSTIRLSNQFVSFLLLISLVLLVSWNVEDWAHAHCLFSPAPHTFVLWRNYVQVAFEIPNAQKA